MVSLRLKGKWSIRHRQGFYSNYDDINLPFAGTHVTLNWYDPLLICITVWEKVLGLKGGEKAKGL
jgi:hypothetical protein